MSGPIYGTGGKLNYVLLNTHNPPKRDTQAVPQVLGMAGMGRRRLRQAMGGMAGMGGPVSSPSSITAAMGGAATGGWAVLRFRADNPSRESAG